MEGETSTGVFLLPVSLSVPTPTLEAARWLRSVMGANGHRASLCYKSPSSLADASRRHLFRMLSIVFIVKKPLQTVNKALRAKGKGLSHVPSSLKPSWQPYHSRESLCHCSLSRSPSFVPSAQVPSLKRHLQPAVPRDILLSLLVLRQGWETVSVTLA